MKVSVTIYEDQVDSDYGYVDGLRVTCDRCGHWVEVGGVTSSSAARGACMLRDQCPNGESNYYEADW